MKTAGLVAAFAAVAVFSADASWLWPFGGEEPVRVSRLIAPVSELIAEAEVMASTNDYDGAIVVYRQALGELDRIEREIPERDSGREFATLKNKRAFVTSAVDSLLLVQARDNAQAIAVCDDTSELERRYAEEQRRAKGTPERPAAAPVKPADAAGAQAVKAPPAVGKKPAAAAQPMVMPTDRHGRIRYARAALAHDDFAAVEAAVKALLTEKPNDAAALNLRAAALAASGDFTQAEAALAQSLKSNPRDYHTFYNMARLLLQFRGEAGRDAARRYYETGRMLNAPEDAELERCFK